MVERETEDMRWEVEAHPSARTARGGIRAPYVCMSPKGQYVASFHGTCCKWKIWHADSGLLHVAAIAHNALGGCLCKKRAHKEYLDKLVVNDHNKDLQVVEEGCPVVGHVGNISSLCFSSCGTKLASGDVNGGVIIWDVATGEVECVMYGGCYSNDPRGSAGGAKSLSFSSDGLQLAAGGSNNVICIWKTTTGTLLQKLVHPEPSYGVSQVMFPPNTRNPTMLRSMSMSSDLKFVVTEWNLTTGEPVVSIPSWHIWISPDGNQYVTLHPPIYVDEQDTGRYVLRVVDSTTHMLVRLLPSLVRSVSDVTWSNDGERITTVDCIGVCKTVDISSGDVLHISRTTQCRSSDRVSVSLGRDWVRDRQIAVAVAVAMGLDERLGRDSRMRALDDEMARMILRYVFDE